MRYILLLCFYGAFLVGCTSKEQSYINYTGKKAFEQSVVRDRLYIDVNTFDVISGDLLLRHQNCSTANYHCIKGELINISIPKSKELLKRGSWEHEGYKYTVKMDSRLDKKSFRVFVTKEEQTSQLVDFVYSYQLGIKSFNIRYGGDLWLYTITGGGLFVNKQKKDTKTLE